MDNRPSRRYARAPRTTEERLMPIGSLAPHPDWIVPSWRAPAHVKALVTTRAGGVSGGAFASLNLGTGAGDDPNAVRENREILRRALPAEPRWLKQVHGTRVIDADDYCGERPAAD